MAYWDKENEYSIIQLRRTRLNIKDTQLKDKLENTKLKFGEPFYVPANHYLIIANSDNQTTTTNYFKFKEYHNDIIDCSVFFDENSRKTIDSKNQDVVQLIDDNKSKIYCVGRAKDIKYGDSNVQNALDNITYVKYAEADYRGGNALGVVTETPTDDDDYFVTGVKGTIKQNQINKLYNAHFNATSENNISPYGVRFNAKTGVLKGAAWNDYAECRHTTESIEAGRVVCENNDDTLSLSKERLQPGANIISDTFGFVIGETNMAKTPIAISGRVLAYPYEDRNSFYAGDAVCSGPNGTVSKMSREEIMKFPERIIGTVSAVPDYEFWGEHNIPVNGRIWIKVK